MNELKRSEKRHKQFTGSHRLNGKEGSEEKMDSKMPVANQIKFSSASNSGEIHFRNLNEVS